MLLCHNNTGGYNSKILTAYFLSFEVRYSSKEFFKKQTLKSALHTTCNTYNKHLQLPQSTFIMNMPSLLWSETTAHLHSILIFQVTLGPTVLFLYVSKTESRHLHIPQNAYCMLKWHRETGKSAACYQLQGPIGATHYKLMGIHVIHNQIWCIFNWDLPLVSPPPQGYSKHFCQNFFLVHFLKYNPKTFP